MIPVVCMFRLEITEFFPTKGIKLGYITICIVFFLRALLKSMMSTNVNLHLCSKKYTFIKKYKHISIITYIHTSNHKNVRINLFWLISCFFITLSERKMQTNLYSNLIPFVEENSVISNRNSHPTKMFIFDNMFDEKVCII